MTRVSADLGVAKGIKRPWFDAFDGHKLHVEHAIKV